MSEGARAPKQRVKTCHGIMRLHKCFSEWIFLILVRDDEPDGMEHSRNVCKNGEEDIDYKILIELLRLQEDCERWKQKTEND